MAAIDIRAITESEFPAWSDALDIGFASPQNRDAGVFRKPFWTDQIAEGRVFAGFDGDEVVGTFGAFGAKMAVPGGVLVDVGAVTAVAVLATHRRRGILSGMMAASLRQSVELGEAASILIPAEYPIYGRFGYGVATQEAHYKIDATEARLVRPLPGTVSFVSPEQWCELGSEFLGRIHATSPGTIGRQEWWWRRTAGLLKPEGKDPDKDQLFAVVRDDEGVVRGHVRYTIKSPEAWDGFRPKQRIEASIEAESAQARVRLMQFLWEQDWIAEVEVEHAPTEDTWRRLLVNARVAWPDEVIDTVWVRPLDVPALLSQRTYTNEGRLIVAVTDKDGYAEGTYALEGGPAGATCTRTTESPELTMPAQTLGSLYLGGHAASSLAEVGLANEERAGALAVADRMFRTVTSPFAATWF